VGRNGLLISGQYGSWFLIGEILTTLDLSGTIAVNGRHGGCPTGCRRCLDVCPTGALLGEARINASRCLSYLTIEHKGTIPQELRPLMGDWLFGCDLCQEVCPLNVRRRVTKEADFLAHRAGSSRELAQILTIRNHKDMVRLFAGSPLMRPGRTGLVRNACVVAANTGSVDLLPQLRKLCQDADGVVGEHARWAVSRLS
jgi:epoxyqueuosine reductase